jgi:hypothetical protein
MPIDLLDLVFIQLRKSEWIFENVSEVLVDS